MSKTPESRTAAFYEKLVSQASSDPGLPTSSPSISYWQLPPHPQLSQTQSDTLPTSTDFAIIGSGITGCSIAKHLLENPSHQNASVTVLEARTLTSGATGRNGGGLATFAPYTLPTMLQQYGEQKTVEIIRFLYHTLEKMHEIGGSTEEIKHTSEIRRTRDVTGFWDNETFEEMKTSFLMLERMMPDVNLKVEILDPATALKQFGVKTVGGAIRFNSGAFWPYRFVTTLWQQLFSEYSDRLRIETNTPVTDISFEAETQLYQLKTPRGTVKANKVVHATNGYAGHLLPRMRGKIYPVRGYMSAQHPGKRFGEHGRDRTWSFSGKQSIDLVNGIQPSSIYYGNQSPNDQTIFWGSDMAPIDSVVTADDSIVPDVTRQDLSRVLPLQFDGWDEDESPAVKNIWAGTLGYTADDLPFVGELPVEVTGRGIAGGEWICAGFNGAGMCQCWPAGETVAKMMLGEDGRGIVPDLYLVTEERLRGETMNAEHSIRQMFLGDN